jgi:anti-sigma regulatory factor (Ser/Thr protein kinase)
MDNNIRIRSIILENKMTELERIQAVIEELSEEWDISFALSNTMNLVLEEAFSNLVNYAYKDEKPHTIETRFEKRPDRLVITLIDDSPPYDPTRKGDPDISLSAEERPIGGLGIFLIKKLMDEVEYKQVDNLNHFIMTKYIPA